MQDLDILRAKLGDKAKRIEQITSGKVRATVLLGMEDA